MASVTIERTDWDGGILSVRFLPRSTRHSFISGQVTVNSQMEYEFVEGKEWSKEPRTGSIQKDFDINIPNDMRSLDVMVTAVIDDPVVAQEQKTLTLTNPDYNGGSGNGGNGKDRMCGGIEVQGEEGGTNPPGNGGISNRTIVAGLAVGAVGVGIASMGRGE